MNLRIKLASVLLWSLSISCSPDLPRGEDDYEFMPPGAWRNLSETGGDDASIVPGEGFEGLRFLPGKDPLLMPVDGQGGSVGIFLRGHLLGNRRG